MSETLQAGQIKAAENLQMIVDNGGGEVMGYHPEIIDGPSGVYMAETLLPSALEVEFKNVEPIKELSLGAADTHHEVQFANVKYTNAEQETKEVLVGVKHFDDALENAVSECDSLLAVLNMGFDAIAPVAIVKESESSSYLVTLFRPDVAALDNEDWTPRPKEKGFAKLTENLSFIAESMAALHSRGVFHGDAQPKNFMRSDTGSQVVVDLEVGCTIAKNAEEHAAHYNATEEAQMGTALHDLKLIWTTLNRPIGLQPENIFLGQEGTPDELYNVFKDHFVKPYLTKLEQDTDPSVLVKLNIEAVMAQLEAQVRSNLGMEAAKHGA